MMAEYKLIGRDQMEPSLLRRKLDPWEPSKAVRVRPLIRTLFDQLGIKHLQINSPAWETNVFPLYYYYFDSQQMEKEWTFKRILQEARTLFCDSCASIPDTTFYLQTSRMADSEIDLLIEDEDYFIFVEAKTSLPGKQIKFGRNGGIHQLVWQYAQGLFLQKAIGKEFLIATLGGGITKPLRLNNAEQDLLRLLGEARQELVVHDLPWTIFDTAN